MQADTISLAWNLTTGTIQSKVYSIPFLQRTVCSPWLPCTMLFFPPDKIIDFLWSQVYFMGSLHHSKRTFSILGVRRGLLLGKWATSPFLNRRVCTVTALATTPVASSHFRFSSKSDFERFFSHKCVKTRISFGVDTRFRMLICFLIIDPVLRSLEAIYWLWTNYCTGHFMSNITSGIIFFM